MNPAEAKLGVKSPYCPSPFDPQISFDISNTKKSRVNKLKAMAGFQRRAGARMFKEFGGYRRIKWHTN